MARYRIQFGDREVDLPGGELIVGRDMGCHVRLKAPSVSRRHVRILQVANSVMAYDLGVSERTIEIHRSRVMKKMEANSLPHLVRMALDLK